MKGSFLQPHSISSLFCLFTGFLLLHGPASMHAQEGNPQIREGNRAYREGDFRQSEISYRKALEKDPDSEKAGYNLANALYRQGQYGPAAEKLTELAGRETGNRDKSRFYHNLGNAKYMNGQYAESIEAYKNALKMNPKDQDSRHNLLKAMQMLQKQQEQQKQNQQQDQQKDQQQDQQQPNQKPDQNQGSSKNENDQQKKSDQNSGENPSEPQAGKQHEDAADNSERQQISREDAERILRALENDEKAVFREARDKQQQVQQVPVEKNW